MVALDNTFIGIKWPVMSGHDHNFQEQRLLTPGISHSSSISHFPSREKVSKECCHNIFNDLSSFLR